MMLET